MVKRMNHCNYTIYGIPVKCNHPISYLNMQSTSKAGLFLSIQYMKTELQMNQILIHSTQQGYRIQLAHYMDVLIHHDKPIIECQTEKEEYLFSTLFNIPFSVYFTLQNELLLHVSSMECQNRLLCFAGEKGTGKSTLVSALDGKFLQIYSDDTLRVDRHQFGYRAHPYTKLTNETLQKLNLKNYTDRYNISGKRYCYIQTDANERKLAAFILLKRSNNINCVNLYNMNHSLEPPFLLQNIVGIQFFNSELIRKCLSLIQYFRINCYILEIPNDLNYLIDSKEEIISQIKEKILGAQ